MNLETRLKQLVSGLLDDNLSKEDAKELDQLLKDNEEARKIYRRMMDMEMSLHESADFELPFQDLPEPEEMPDKFRSTRFQLHVFQAIAACLVTALIISLSVKSSKIETPARVQLPHVKNEIEAISLAKIADLSQDVQWQGTKRKLEEMIFEEILEIDSGMVLLRYENGAEIKLEGPCRYELKSLTYSKLAYGSLAARIPQAAQGFTVDSPTASVVDLGTEFSMLVKEDGETEVFVFEGEVETSLIGEDGNSLKHARLSKNEGVKIGKDLELLDEVNHASSFIRMDAQDNPPIDISPAYVQAVSNDDPVAYWRFEQGREFLNEKSELYPMSFENGLEALDGFLSFQQDNEHFIQVDSPIEGINSNGYSVEFWINPDEYRSQMSLLSFVLPGKPTWHLLYTSLTGKNDGLRHSPFNVRMSSRFPAANGSGHNCFSNQKFELQEWSHYVFVKDEESLKIYINGDLANSVATNLGSDDQAYQLCFGRIDPERSMRYFVGQMDELAIYNYPLTAQQIQSHFHAQSKVHSN
ncbi:FecR domain-containing protein [Lentisphaera marina]|uniref:LamG-like jellyroll fold domain-containing protein n=1 Tax=Lentisphaera marina TaxID=1111041 RepID=UPI0023651E45|nr:LamG-like jellyroll fold domain-containing protein [Lentisphaera marina]MDD7984042.1 FecR domain-containing protein [Lentisphaera marina]